MDVIDRVLLPRVTKNVAAAARQINREDGLLEAITNLEAYFTNE